MCFFSKLKIFGYVTLWAAKLRMFRNDRFKKLVIYELANNVIDDIIKWPRYRFWSLVMAYITDFGQQGQRFVMILRLPLYLIISHLSTNYYLVGVLASTVIIARSDTTSIRAYLKPDDEEHH
jgi:hypothetical protein